MIFNDVFKTQQIRLMNSNLTVDGLAYGLSLATLESLCRISSVYMKRTVQMAGLQFFFLQVAEYHAFLNL